MKTLAFPFIFLSLLFANQAFARILTVANQTTPQVAQYNSIQAAHDAAQSGDTIYVYPTLSAYKGAKLSKKIVLIGAGFSRINEYSDLSKITNTDTLHFKAGSENSIISSIIGNFKIIIESNNIHIDKCKSKEVFIDKNLNGILITRSVIGSYERCINVSENSYATIANNILNSNNGTISIGTNGSCLIKNNIIFSNYDGVVGYHANLYNNIFCTNTTYSLNNDGIAQNNSPALQYYDNSRQQWFVDYNKGDYHLKETSSGKNAGTDGKDLGIYGGDYPFIDDGAPALPTIYYMKVSPTASQKDGLSVEIKAKTN